MPTGRPPTHLIRVLSRHLEARKSGEETHHRYIRKLFYDVITEADVSGRARGLTTKEIWGTATSTDARMNRLADHLSEFMKREGIGPDALHLEASPAGESYDEKGGRHYWTVKTPVDLPVVLVVEKRTVAPELAAEMRRHGIKVVTSSGGVKSEHLTAIARYRAMGVPVFLMSDEDVGGWQSTKSAEEAGAVRITLADLEKATGKRVPPLYILEDTSLVNQPHLVEKAPAGLLELLGRLRGYGRRTGLPYGRVEMEGQENTFGGPTGYASAIASVISSRVGEVDHRQALVAQLEANPDAVVGGVLKLLRDSLVKAARGYILSQPIRAPLGVDMAVHLRGIRGRIESTLPSRVKQAIRVLEEWVSNRP